MAALKFLQDADYLITCKHPDRAVWVTTYLSDVYAYISDFATQHEIVLTSNIGTRSYIAHSFPPNPNPNTTAY